MFVYIYICVQCVHIDRDIDIYDIHYNMYIYMSICQHVNMSIYQKYQSRREYMHIELLVWKFNTNLYGFLNYVRS